MGDEVAGKIGSAGKHAGYPYREPRFGPEHPYGASQLPTTTPEDPMPPLASVKTAFKKTYTYTQTHT